MLIVEVNTELLPTPHLELSIDRIGTANFVSDFTVLVAFPFDAFTAELLPRRAESVLWLSDHGQRWHAGKGSRRHRPGERSDYFYAGDIGAPTTSLTSTCRRLETPIPCASSRGISMVMSTPVCWTSTRWRSGCSTRPTSSTSGSTLTRTRSACWKCSPPSVWIGTRPAPL